MPKKKHNNNIERKYIVCIQTIIKLLYTRSNVDGGILIETNSKCYKHFDVFIWHNTWMRWHDNVEWNNNNDDANSYNHQFNMRILVDPKP